MNKMTRETLQRLHALNDELKKQKEYAAELLRTAKDRYSHKKHNVIREGKTIHLEEKTLWQEVFILGYDCEAAKIMEKEYPEVFTANRRADQIAAELKNFSIVELGVDFTALTLSDYLQLTEQMLVLLLEEREQFGGTKNGVTPGKPEADTFNLEA